jgi:hypothetical protein
MDTANKHRTRMFVFAVFSLPPRALELALRSVAPVSVLQTIPVKVSFSLRIGSFGKKAKKRLKT